MAYIQLGDICDIVKGEIGITKATPGDYPMVTTGEERKSHNKFQLDTNAVLIPLVSATGHGHASISRIHYQEGKFAFGSILAACIPKDKRYSAKFLHIYFSLMKDFVLVPLMKGSANVSLTLGNLKTAKVPKISSENQLKIVELYSNLKIEQDKAIDLLNLQRNDIDKLRQSILQEAVQGKLTADWRAKNPDTEDATILLKRIQKEKVQLVKDKKIKKEKPLPKITKEEIPYELPEGWVWCRLGQSGYTQTGSTPPKKDLKNYGDFIPFIGPADISNNWMKYPKDGLSEKGIFVGRLIPKNSLMMVCIGGSIGKCNINEIDVSCNQQINTVTPLNIPVDYVKVVCQSPYFQEEVFDKSSGSATPIINKGKWEALPFSLPPLKEQKAIVQKVNALMGLCDALEQEVKQSQEQSEQLMQSCLREVFEEA